MSSISPPSSLSLAKLNELGDLTEPMELGQPTKLNELGGLTCQNAGPGANNAADAFMHSLRDELRTDGQGATSRNQGTALGP
ncbi:hypothetical protein PCASD_24025 [Puccinia coronata f. sp. avenae]|uniref:Uncharacterized protein n=1 Tax=Puccinia coronata f. sp. avenae TaxID=200324 RepID=A0A2N5TRS4_9BASI|nr:hypothetical protein PCASD_24025 [Puccinia coronata f. sp. avenae]